jgi:hypothetical protein
MHCPQCGQEQISGEARFCKGCGFPLDGVRELLATGGISPTLDKEGRQPRESPRRKGVRQGVMLLFMFMVSMPLYGLIGKPIFALPPLFLMAGLMRILYAVIFQEGAPRKKKQDSSLPYVAPITTGQPGTEGGGPALPPSHSMPVPVFNARRLDTAEMVSPPSVTEHTTKLLDESQDSE